MKNKKYHTVSEQFQNPIVKIVKGSKIIAIFGPRQQDSSMSGSNRRFTIMLQSDANQLLFLKRSLKIQRRKSEAVKWKTMNWPKEKGQKDKQWSTKRCKHKLKIEKHETNKNRKDVNQLQTERLYIARCHLTLILGYELWSLLKTLLWLWNAERQYNVCSECLFHLTTPW